MYSLGRDLVRLAWRHHFRIPEALHWLAAFMAVSWIIVVRPSASIESFDFLIPGILGVVGIAGVIRWKSHRRAARGGLVVPLFAAAGPTRGYREEVQEAIVASLKNKLAPEHARRVRAVPIVVGGREREFAAKLRSRLKAQFIVFGQIADVTPARTGAAKYSVYASTARPAPDLVLHADWHTRDITPAKPRWAPLFERLKPAKDVVDAEDPLEFTQELEAIIVGLAGQVAACFGDADRAEPELRSAIEIAPRSASWQVDQLRADLARSLSEMNRFDDAASVLNPRIAEKDPSPELLRTVHEIYFGSIDAPELPSPFTRKEALSALRRAAEVRSDPIRPQTLYNLAMSLEAEVELDRTSEAEAICQELRASPSHYKRAWYIRRMLGVFAWHRHTTARALPAPDIANTYAKRAARYYSQAIRRRPRFRFFFVAQGRAHLLARFPRSAIMHANAFDAHRNAGNRIRARWHLTRTERVRAKLLKRAESAMRERDWQRAYAAFDWMVVGWEGELPESTARVGKAIALQNLGDPEAEDAWGSVRSFDAPLAMLLRASLAELAGLTGEALPGKGPLDVEQVQKMMKRAPAESWYWTRSGDARTLTFSAGEEMN